MAQKKIYNEEFKIQAVKPGGEIGCSNATIEPGGALHFQIMYLPLFDFSFAGSFILIHFLISLLYNYSFRCVRIFSQHSTD